MKQNNIFFLLLLMAAFSACRNKQVVQTADYSRYMHGSNALAKSIQRSNNEIEFWNQRLQKDTGNFVCMVKMAHQHIYQFKLAANVASLYKADSLLLRASAKLNNSDPSLFYTLSQNSVTQHQFRRAYAYDEQARAAGGRETTTNLLLFDVYMELGRYADAALVLSQLKEKDSFDYLIRQSKYEDHKGNQDRAIALLEQAYDKVKNSGNTGLRSWALSNLGDIYSHAGRVQEAYNTYLDVLKIDSSYQYVLKGIAWIAFAHDGNTAEAKRIIHFLQSQKSSPDYLLQLAEIAEYEKNTSLQQQYLQQFYAEVNQPKYGEMYNKYKALVLCEHLSNAAAAVQIAEREIQQRPSTEVYDLLAWTYFHAGRIKEAVQVIETELEGKSFEPVFQYHAALIYKAAGDTKKATYYRTEARKAGFELGPVVISLLEKGW